METQRSDKGYGLTLSAQRWEKTDLTSAIVDIVSSSALLIRSDESEYNDQLLR